MANNKNNRFLALSTLDTIPLSTATAVTITNTIGGSSFTLSAGLDGFSTGAWIWDTVGGKVYKVRSMAIGSSVKGTIWGTFDSTFTAMQYIKTLDARIIQRAIVADAATTVDGTALAAGESLNDSTVGLGAIAGVRFVDPVVVDGATGAVRYMVTKF